jgi:uncharacterized protein YkwD
MSLPKHMAILCLDHGLKKLRIKIRFQMKKLLLTSMVLTLSATLFGCGGGGGSTPAPVVTPPVVVVTPPPPVAVEKLQAAIAPTYNPQSEEYGFSHAVNAFRTIQGLGPLNQNLYYDNASKAHALYMFQYGFGHIEIAGNNGFTGVNPLDRVKYQGGNAAFATDEIGVPHFIGEAGSGVSFASVLINTIYHRAGLMYQGLTDIGVSIGMNFTSQSSSVSVLGYVTPQQNSGTYFGKYPADGQTGISLHMHPELPSPVPDGTDINTIGSPIHVASQATTTLKVTSFTVTQAGASAPMSATLHTDTDPNLRGSINLAFLLPNQAYLPNTVYTVNFVGTITGDATGTKTGIAVNKTWSFTTGTTSD